MAGEIDLASLVISLKADVEGLQASFDESQKVVRNSTQEAEDTADSFEDHIERGFERVGERLLEYFAIEKVAEFVEQSIEEYAKVERAFDVLGAQIDSSGQKWGALSGQVNDFVEAEERMYGTTKENVIAALSDAELGTKNLGAALKITDEAELLSTITKHSLQESVEEISRAYAGNTRGLRQLGNELLMNNADSADAVKVFSKLQEKTEALNGHLDDEQQKINALSATWEDLKESVGGFVAIFEPFVQFIVDDLQDGINQLRTLNNVLDHSMRILNDLMSFRSPKQNWDALIADAKSYGDTLDKIWGDTNAQKLESDKQQLAEVKANADKAAAALAQKKLRAEEAKEKKEALAMEKEAYASLQTIGERWESTLKDINSIQVEDVEKGSAEAVEAAQQAVDSLKKQWETAYGQTSELEKKSVKLWHEAMLKPGKEAEHAAKSVEQAYEKHLQKMLELERKYRNALASLTHAQDDKAIADQKKKDDADQAAQDAKDLAALKLQQQHEAEVAITTQSLELATKSADAWKASAQVQKQIAAASAIWDTAQAVAQANADYPWPLSAGVMALVAAEGAVEVAKIESTSFAEGGIVTSPTLSTIGDGNEPEMALPLSKAREMGFGGGGDTHNHYNSFPGVTNANEARKVGESHGAAFIRQQTRAKVLSGNRNTRF